MTRIVAGLLAMLVAVGLLGGCSGLHNTGHAQSDNMSQMYGVGGGAGGGGAGGGGGGGY